MKKTQPKGYEPKEGWPSKKMMTARAGEMFSFDFLFIEHAHAAEAAIPVSYHFTSVTRGPADKEHGRLEQKRMTISSMLCGQLGWPGLAQVFKIEREIEELSMGKRRNERVYGVTSLTSELAPAKKLLELVRKHWMVENGLHL